MMFSENGGRPGDQRGFVHKKIGRLIGTAVQTFVPGVSTAVRVIKTAKSLVVKEQKQLGADAKFGVTGPGRDITDFGPQKIARRPGGFGSGPRARGLKAGPCDFPMVLDKEGRCRMPTSGEFGGEQFGVGAAVMGRYGAALEPGSQIIDRAICLRGMQLGDDGLCYNKAQISNKQRMWPAGRKPLLTGGEMGAISVASRAGRRLEAATKRLQRLGMMKKPASRRALPHAHAKAATGVVSV